MKTSLLIAVFSVVPFGAGWVLGGGLTPKLPATYTDNACGFRIQAPSLSEGAHGTVAAFMCEPSEQFAPNINVVSQPAVGAAEYREQSLRGFEQLGLEKLREETGKLGAHEMITWEYKGRQQGHDLRFLSRAIFLPERVLLVTCTATERQYESRRTAFEAAINSIELIRDRQQKDR